MGTPMTFEGSMKSFAEAMTLEWEGEEILAPLSEPDNGLISVSLRTIWADPVIQMDILLRIPEVYPLRFPWDNGFHGWVVQMGRSSERFCHPRLRSEVADTLAVSNTPAIPPGTDFRFYWETFFDRLHESIWREVVDLSKSARRATVSLATTRLQRGVMSIVNGAPGVRGLPLTDDAYKLRHMFEVELGYPQSPNQSLHDQIKLRFVREVDDVCDILFTGKHQTGKYVIRVRPEAPKSFITKRPMSDLCLAIQGLSVYSDPVRLFRENRSLCQCKDFVDPQPVPIRTKGMKIPDVLAGKITSLLVCIGDIPGVNIYHPSLRDAMEFGVKEDDCITADSIPLCPSGARKLLVKETRSDLISPEEFEEEREELEKLPGFRFEESRNLVEVLDNGAAVYEHQIRYFHNRENRCRYDKLKLLLGGLKGVTKPVPQLFAGIDGGYVPVDIVVSEKAVFAKGAIRDLVPGAMATMAGIEEFDTSCPLEEFKELIREGLREKGRPETGRFPIFTSRSVPFFGDTRLTHQSAPDVEAIGGDIQWKIEYIPIGEAVVGYVPVARAQETEDRSSSTNKGISINMVDARNLISIPFPYSEKDEQDITDIARFFNFGYDYVSRAT